MAQKKIYELSSHSSIVSTDVFPISDDNSGNAEKQSISGLTSYLSTAITGIPATSISDGSISNTEFGYLNGVTSNIQTQIDGKANTSHTHSISDVTGLQTALDGKSAVGHTHTTSDITNLSSYTGLDGRYYTETEVDSLLSAKQATLVSGTNIKTVNGNSLLGSGDVSITASAVWGSITGTLSSQTDLQTALDGKVDENVAITGATKTKITYDTKGLVTAGADATTADIADSTDKRYVTDAQLTVIGNTSGTNTGDQNLFSTIAVSGQSNVVADSTSDTLTLVAGTNITITTDASTDSITINSTGGGGTPGGSNTQLQYNNAGAFGGISGATTDGTSVTYTTGNLKVADVQANGSGGVEVKNNSGTNVAIFGAGGGTGITLVGNTNIGNSGPDYHQLAGGTGTITDTATGTSTDININLVPKGTGRLQAGGVNVPTISSSDTLTNKTINLSSNTLTTTVAQLNTAISDGDIVTLAGNETISGNKTFGAGNLLVTDVIASGSAGIEIKNNSGTNTIITGAGGGTGTSIQGTTNIGSGSTDYLQVTGGTGTTTAYAAGGSANVAFEVGGKGTGRFTMVDGTDRTKKVNFDLSSISSGATRTITIGNANMALVGTSTSQTLTNKTMALGSNTISGTMAQFNTAVTDGDIVFQREQWFQLTGTFASATTFTTTESSAGEATRMARLASRCLFTCTNSTGATRRIGYIKSASSASTTVTYTVVTDSDLASGDINFRIATFSKVEDYQALIAIPGEQVADASNPQGMYYRAMRDSYLLPVNSFVRTAAAGAGAACAWNIYKGSTNLFTSAQDMTTNSTYDDRRPNTNTISANDIITARVTSSAGATNKASDLSIQLFVVPQELYLGQL